MESATWSGLRLERKVAVMLSKGGDRNMGECTARVFKENGATVVIADADVEEEDQVREAVDAAVAQHGKLDVVVVVYSNKQEKGGSILDEEDGTSLQGGLSGAFYVGKHAARVMMPRKMGSILFLSTSAGACASSSSYVQMASRYGILGLVRNLSAELGPHGVRVNCISADGIDALAVAKAALYLASHHANYVSGHNLVLAYSPPDPLI